EKIFLTNDFDDPLEGFDTNRYVPCLRVDDLVFKLGEREVRQRLRKATGVEIDSPNSLSQAIGKLFSHFKNKGARACAVSLPPIFQIELGMDPDFHFALAAVIGATKGIGNPSAIVEQGVFKMLVAYCQEFRLPFDLMIGVNRRVYRYGV